MLAKRCTAIIHLYKPFFYESFPQHYSFPFSTHFILHHLPTALNILLTNKVHLVTLTSYSLSSPLRSMLFPAFNFFLYLSCRPLHLFLLFPSPYQSTVFLAAKQILLSFSRILNSSANTNAFIFPPKHSSYGSVSFSSSRHPFPLC